MVFIYEENYPAYMNICKGPGQNPHQDVIRMDTKIIKDQPTASQKMQTDSNFHWVRIACPRLTSPGSQIFYHSDPE